MKVQMVRLNDLNKSKWDKNGICHVTQCGNIELTKQSIFRFETVNQGRKTDNGQYHQ